MFLDWIFPTESIVSLLYSIIVYLSIVFKCAPLKMVKFYVAYYQVHTRVNVRAIDQCSHKHPENTEEE